MELNELKASGEAPDWLTEESYATLRGGYLLVDETPKAMYVRISKSAAHYLNKPELAEKFFNYIWSNWLCPSSPVASNSGSTRGLPISCFGACVPDSVQGIFDSVKETAMLSKHGGGTSKYWGKLRSRGATISDNGASDGIIPWLKVEEATLHSVSQGGVRRGSGAQYLDIDSPDAEEFIDIRRKTGDINRRCQVPGFHHGVCISDDFMNRCKSGDTKSRSLWERLLTTRIEEGEPYIFFSDNVNNQNPECYKQRGLKVHASNLCSEIDLHSDEDHTFVCCLSSLNLARYDEWKDTDLIRTSIWFLDGIMSEFIDKAKNISGLEKAVRFAIKSRALGLGVLGWHTLLQSKMIPFESYQAMQLNAEVFSLLDRESLEASKELAKEHGEVEWTKGNGIRNTHRLAIAPTFSNSVISGGVSLGIEPIVANMFAKKTAKGTFITKNLQLQKLLKDKNKDTIEVWSQINEHAGSVSRLDFLSDLEKEVFATAKEISQFAIVRQAAQRQKWIDQGQSVNLFFAAPTNLDIETRQKLGKYIHEVHWLAWELGMKALYYCRPSAILAGDSVFREESACKSCEG